MDKAHGRLEIRSIQSLSTLSDCIDFPYCKQVFRLTREITKLKTAKKTVEIVYGITSLSDKQADNKRLLQLNRGHWSIENRSHYVRDWNFDEDRSQIRKGKAAHLMATLRNFAISLLRFAQVKNIAAALRTIAAKSYLALRLLRL